MPSPMPDRILTGGVSNYTFELLVHREQDYQASQQGDQPNFYFPGEYVFGYRLPDWQRPPVWTTTQRVRFIESCYLGLDIGRFVFTQAQDHAFGGPLDNLLLDGQQRLRAIRSYLNGDFPVFGAAWPDLSDRDRRKFTRLMLPVLYIRADDVTEAFLIDLYTRMNYGGTPHQPEHHPAARPPHP